jgi:hypothetical protein
MSTPARGARAAQEVRDPEISPTCDPGQVAVLPPLADARARLLDVIRQKPAPVPAPRPARDWVRIPTSIATPRMIPTVVGVTSRAVLYWRRGERTPRWRHKRKLLMLQAMVRRARL